MGVRVRPLFLSQPLGVAVLREFMSMEPLLFDCSERALGYGLHTGSYIGLAVIEPALDLGAALGVSSCGCRVDLLQAVAILPGCRGHGWGRLFVQHLLRLHPRLVCVAAEGTEGFWRALAPSMVVYPGDREGRRFVSAEVAAHIRACGLCWPGV